MLERQHVARKRAERRRRRAEKRLALHLKVLQFILNVKQMCIWCIELQRKYVYTERERDIVRKYIILSWTAYSHFFEMWELQKISSFSLSCGEDSFQGRGCDPADLGFGCQDVEDVLHLSGCDLALLLLRHGRMERENRGEPAKHWRKCFHVSLTVPCVYCTPLRVRASGVHYKRRRGIQLEASGYELWRLEVKVTSNRPLLQSSSIGYA